MSVPTTKRNYPFPTERLNPYYDDLFDMFQVMDGDIQDAWDAISGGSEDNTLAIATANTTPVKMAVVSGTLNTEINKAYLVELMLIAKEDDTAGTPGGIKSWNVRFTARNDADGNGEVVLPIHTTVLQSTSISDEADWAISSIDVNDATAGDPIEIYVAGGAATVSWTATAKVTTVAEMTP